MSAPSASSPSSLAASRLPILVVGISHRSASVAVRERLAVAAEERAALLGRIREGAAVSEAMVLSTCNRVEVYAVGTDLEAARDRVVSTLGGRAPGEDLRPYLYERRGKEAVLHTFRVASSLDSLVVGEPQILGQMKEAYEGAVAAEAIGSVLGRALHRAFHVAKRVRTETALGVGQVSVASVAVDLARKIFSDLGGREVLVLGAGEIAESAARALKAGGASRILIANRSFDRAEALARSIDGASARSLGELPSLLEHADVVLVSTGAAGFVVTREAAATAMKHRRGRPLFFVDVAVPRNVDPRVHDLDNCYRYDIDDLEQIVSAGMAGRQKEADVAEQLVAAECDGFLTWARQLEVTPTIVALRERVRSMLAAELERTLAARLKHLGEDDRKSLGVMLDAAANKLLHGPTRALKAATESPDGDLLVDAVRRIFDLPEPTLEVPNDADPGDRPPRH
ncbi:MAG: glutamyl-tRNA reductase [Polyangiales bacterium]